MLPRPSSVQSALDVLLWSLWSGTEDVLVGVLSENSGSCDEPASVIGRLKVTGPERAVKPRADLQFLVGEWPSQQQSHAAIDRL